MLSSDKTLPCPFLMSPPRCSPRSFLTGGTPYQLCDLQARALTFLSSSVLIRTDIMIPTLQGNTSHRRKGL